MKMEISIEEKARRYDEAYKKVAVRFGSNVADERTWIINYLSNRILNSTIIAEKGNLKKAIAWLEKQGEHAKFCDSIQVGDKVTRNQDGMLVNLSQLERVAKPAEKVEPKFHEGEWITIKE